MAIDEVFGDSRFYGLDPDQRQQVVTGILGKDDRFNALPDDQKQQVISGVLEKRGFAKGFDDLAHSVMIQESGGKLDVEDGKAGEIGPMQIMPSTAEQYGYSEKDLRDPQKNIAIGRQILADLIQKNNGNVQRALYAYNAGQGAVNKNKIPTSTQQYATDILSRADQLRDEGTRAQAMQDVPKPIQWAAQYGPTAIGGAVSALTPIPGVSAATGYAAQKEADIAAQQFLQKHYGVPMQQITTPAQDLPQMAQYMIPGGAGAAAAEKLGAGAIGRSIGFGAGATAPSILNDAYQMLKDPNHEPAEPNQWLKDLKENSLQALAAELGGGAVRGIPPTYAKLRGEGVARKALTEAETTATEKAKAEGADIKYDIGKTVEGAQAAAQQVPELGPKELAPARAEVEAQQSAKGQSELEKTLGTTPEIVAAGKATSVEPSIVPIHDENGNIVDQRPGAPISVSDAMRMSDQKRSWFGPINGALDAMGPKFDQFEKIYGGEALPKEKVANLAKEVGDQYAYFGDNRMEMSKPVAALFDRINQRLNYGDAFSVKDFLSWRREASKLMATEKDPANANAMHELVETIDDQLPGAERLRAQYRSQRVLFDRNLMRKISVARDPSDLVKDILGDQKRFPSVVKGATPQEMGNIRQMFAEHVLDPTKGYTPDKIREQFHPDVLRSLGFKDEWIRGYHDADTMDRLVANSPKAQALRMQALHEHLQGVTREAAGDIVKLVSPLVKYLPRDKVGPIEEAIKGGKSPEEAAQIATQIVDDVMRDKPRWEAIRALGKIKEDWMVRYADRRRYFHAAFLLGGLLSGLRLPTFFLGSMMIETGAKMLGNYRNSFYESLRDPKVAESFYRKLLQGDVRRSTYDTVDMAVNATAGKIREQEQEDNR